MTHNPPTPGPVVVSVAPKPASAGSVVVSAYFARWRRRDTGRWSRIHWFRNGDTVCGVSEPPVEYDFDLPSEPILTCVACSRANLLMQETGRAPSAKPAPGASS